MATMLAAPACRCSDLTCAALPRARHATASTSYGVRTRRRNSTFSLGVRAEAREGAGRERRGEAARDEVSELESALGIDKKTVRNDSADMNALPRRITMLDAIEEQMRLYEKSRPPENKFFRTIRAIGDWLIDKTENTGGQDNVVRFAFALFPMWFFALLVTSGVIVLPFDHPFLHDLARHIAETQ